MKKINLVFRIMLIIVATIGVLHTGITYIVTLINYQPTVTSFPAEAVLFFVGIWYVIGIVALLLVWLATWLINKAHLKREMQKSVNKLQ